MDANTYLVEQTRNVVDLLVGISWPAVALIILVTFRRQIGALLPRIREGEFLGTKWKFDPEDAEPAVAAAAEATGAPRVPFYFTESSAYLRELATEQPELAVVGAFAAIEKALRDRFEWEGVEVPADVAGMRLVDLAVQRQVIALPVGNAIKSLRRLRNAAAHGSKVERTAALDYIGLCDQVLYILTWDRGS